MVTDSHDLSVERFSPDSSLRHAIGSGNPDDPNVIWTGVPTESTGNRRCVSGGDVSLETVADHHEDPRNLWSSKRQSADTMDPGRLSKPSLVRQDRILRTRLLRTYAESGD